jgi:hypothetical protein
MGQTSKFLFLETIHCHVEVQEDIDPVRDKDPIMYRGQALCLELLQLAEKTWARGQSQSSWLFRTGEGREPGETSTRCRCGSRATGGGQYEDSHVEDYARTDEVDAMVLVSLAVASLDDHILDKPFGVDQPRGQEVKAASMLATTQSSLYAVSHLYDTPFALCTN